MFELFPRSSQVPVHSAIEEIGLAPSPDQVDFFRALIAEAARDSGEGASGHVSVPEIFRTAVDAGLGAGAGAIAAKTLGGLFGMPALDRRALIGAGALGGALYAMSKEGSEGGMEKEAVLSDLLMMSVLFPYLLGSAGRARGPKKAPIDELNTSALVHEYNRGIKQLQQEQLLRRSEPEVTKGQVL